MARFTVSAPEPVGVVVHGAMEPATESPEVWRAARVAAAAVVAEAPAGGGGDYILLREFLLLLLLLRLHWLLDLGSQLVLLRKRFANLAEELVRARTQTSAKGVEGFAYEGWQGGLRTLSSRW